ncbi:hypothetical protein L218DRAFT_132831 [Marasmius fiardii PR-910]|nr:hypothetical protein L218DRAFT_132831 [Marasmius fiardii PR-910]
MDGHESDTSQPKKTGELEASQVVLETVHDVAELSPVPFLKEAAGCALAILGVVDKMIKYKETTKRLALYACEAIYTVQCGTSGRWDGRQTENRELGESLAEFKATLDNIKQFAEKLTRKPYFFRLIASNLDQQEIASFQTKLNHATDMFILWLNIRSHGSLLEICNNTRYIPVAQLTDPESDTVTLTSSSYALNDFPSQPPLPPKDPQLGGSINGADSVNPLVKNISGNQVNSSALTKHEPPSRMVSGKSEGNFEARGPIESHKNDLSDTSGRVSRGETHEEPSNLDSSPLSNSSSSSPAPTVTAASRPFSSRRALTRALEFAREAVQLDSTNEHPDLAVQAFGKSLALLGEVMKRRGAQERGTEDNVALPPTKKNSKGCKT